MQKRFGNYTSQRSRRHSNDERDSRVRRTKENDCAGDISFLNIDDGVDLLVHRMSKLDDRIADIEQKDLGTRTSRRSGVSPRRQDKQRKKMQTNDDSTDTLESLDVAPAYEELERRLARNEAAILKLKRTGGGSGSKGGTYNESTLEEMQHQIKSLQKKLRTLGDSTSRACRSLSVGVTDSQNASLELYSWADQVHMAFDRISIECLKQNKNILPRPKILQLTSKPSTERSNTTANSKKHKKRRSASAGSERRRSQNDTMVESDYEINF